MSEKSWLYGWMSIKFNIKFIRFASVGIMLMVGKWICNPEEIGANMHIWVPLGLESQVSLKKIRGWRIES